VFDAVFLQFDEPCADAHYDRLLDLHPSTYRIKNVEGIREAHVKGASVCRTTMFFVVDADCWVHEDFNFRFRPEEWDQQYTHVWYANNPVIQSCYGYGGIKLFNRQQVLDSANKQYVDFFAAASPKGLKVIPTAACTTRFDQTPEITFRSVVREIVKLSTGQQTEETVQRIEQWRTTNPSTEFAQQYIAGIRAADDLIKNSQDPTVAINDYNALHTLYKKYTT
jgi:hypothetical protein